MQFLYFPSFNKIVVFVGVFFMSCGGKKDPPAKKPADRETVVDVIVAKPATIKNFIEVNGTVLANEYVELHAEISGRITYLNVPEGSYIKQGTVIARVFNEDLRAQLQKSKAQLDLAEKTEQRLKKLLDVNGLNQADYDLAMNQVYTLKADIAYTQAQIDKSIVRAPFSGTVGLRQVSPGAFVSPSDIIATLQQTNKVKIDFTIPEEYSNIIRKGNSVDVLTDAAKQEHTKAVIIATEPQVNQSTRNLKVRAILDNANSNPGSFVKVTVTDNTNKNAILVPSNSVIPGDKNSQLVLVKNGKAQFADITTGTRLSGNVEITSGVNAGDSVVVTGVLFARQGNPVKVRTVKDLNEVDQEEQ